MVQVITSPDLYSSFNYNPLKVYSSEYTVDNFKYIVNLQYDRVSVSSSTSTSYNGGVYTEITTSSNHNFKVGDSVLIEDYNIIRSVLSSTKVIVNLIQSVLPTGSTISKVIKWNLSPNQEGFGEMDLSNALKDKTYGVFSGSGDASTTRFNYDLSFGSEKKYTFNFDDNIFSGGSVGFHSSGTTSLSGVPFQVGDLIIVQQNQVAWNYFDNYFDGSLVGFTGNTGHSFLVGQTVIVTGQETHPYYNGETTIFSVETDSMVVYKNWQGSTPVEPGIIYGTPRPEYNTTGTIKEIFVDGTYGVVIITDIPFTTASFPISGTIQYADGRITTTPIESVLNTRYSFNSSIINPEYNKYVIKNGSYTGNNISTIFNSTNQYRIERNTMGYLLSHSYNTTYADGLSYVFKDTNGTTLGVIRVPKPSGSTDFYSPIGLEQISQTTYTDIGGTFSSYSGNVDNYEVYSYDATSPTTQVQRTNSIRFKLNDDCSMYEIYHLIWRDSGGSYIPIPFIYKTRKDVEVSRNTFYKKGTGDTTFYSQSKNSFILNSGWLKDFEVDLIEDLMTSPEVFIQFPNNTTYPVIINDTKVELFNQLNDELFSYSFNVRKSLNQYRF